MKSAIALWLVTGLAAVASQAQVLRLTREQMIKYTVKNPYERFADGRPKVPDSLLEKMKGLSAEEMMLAGQGFPNNYAGDLKMLRSDRKPGGAGIYGSDHAFPLGHRGGGPR